MQVFCHWTQGLNLAFLCDQKCCFLLTHFIDDDTNFVHDNFSEMDFYHGEGGFKAFFFCKSMVVSSSNFLSPTNAFKTLKRSRCYGWLLVKMRKSKISESRRFEAKSKGSRYLMSSVNICPRWPVFISCNSDSTWLRSAWTFWVRAIQVVASCLALSRLVERKANAIKARIGSPKPITPNKVLFYGWCFYLKRV